MRLPTAALGTLEIGLNRYLGSDPQALIRCRELSGRCMQLHMHDASLSLYLLPHAGGVQLMDDWSETPDVKLSGSLASFARTLFTAGRSADVASLAGGDLRIEGDVALAQQFAGMLKTVDIDLEDWLGERLGDMPAYFIGQALKQAGGLLQRAGAAFSRDTVEYLREETRDLVHASEVDAWTDDVDRLRADTDRLAARIKRLRQRQGAG